MASFSPSRSKTAQRLTYFSSRALITTCYTLPQGAGGDTRRVGIKAAVLTAQFCLSAADTWVFLSLFLSTPQLLPCLGARPGHNLSFSTTPTTRRAAAENFSRIHVLFKETEPSSERSASVINCPHLAHRKTKWPPPSEAGLKSEPGARPPRRTEPYGRSGHTSIRIRLPAPRRRLAPTPEVAVRTGSARRRSVCQVGLRRCGVFAASVGLLLSAPGSQVTGLLWRGCGLVGRPSAA